MPRLHGRSEASTIENKVIQEVKLEKPEEMSRRIDLHRSTKDCKFRIITYGPANKAFVAVAGFKPTILISACVVVLVSGYGRVSYG